MTKIWKERATIDYNSPLAIRYLALRKKSLYLGITKSLVVPYALYFLNKSIESSQDVPSILDLGCSEGHIIGHIKSVMDQSRPAYPIKYVGLDYNQDLINKAKENYPQIEFRIMNIINISKLKHKFDIIVLINTLHEIYSFFGLNSKKDEKYAKKIVLDTLKKITDKLKKNGVLLIFDGVEHENNPNKKITITLKNKKTLRLLEKFIKEYRGIKIYTKIINNNTAILDIKTFTRFITKLQYIDNPVWAWEKDESYQYFTQKEFVIKLKKLGLTIETINLISPHIGIWSKDVEIQTKNINFPTEHIMIAASKK